MTRGLDIVRMTTGTAGKGDDMKKPYEKPAITTEKVGEALAAGCDLVSIDIGGCDPDFGTVEFSA